MDIGKVRVHRVAEDGFTASVQFNDFAGMKETFEEHGYVVVRGVLEEEEVQRTVDEIWESTVLLGQNPDIDRDDASTWSNDEWPGDVDKGFLDSINPLRESAAWENRQNERLVRVFQTILGRKEVAVKLDRFGVMRPTQGIALPDGTAVDRPDWRTRPRWLHWDQNPIAERQFCRVQGILALTPSTATSGGFMCVPGFHHQFEAWAIAHGEGGSSRQIPYMVPEDDPMQQETCCITMRAGSVVVWDSRLPHQNYPNRDNSFRIVQYITFTPVEDRGEALRRKEGLEAKIRCGLGYEAFPGVLTPLGRLICGLDLWNEEEGSEAAGPSSTPPPRISSEDRDLSLKLLEEAEKAEANGNAMHAMTLYRRAFRLNPLLEAAYQA